MDRAFLVICLMHCRSSLSEPRLIHEVCYQAYIGVSKNVCWNHSMSLNERAGIIHLAGDMANQGRLNEPFLTWYLETMTWDASRSQVTWWSFTWPCSEGVDSFCWPSPNSSIAAHPIWKGKSGGLDLSLVGLTPSSVPCCVSLGKSFTFSDPQFPNL